MKIIIISVLIGLPFVILAKVLPNLAWLLGYFAGIIVMNYIRYQNES
jgi:hypothetical protein